jgi:hypothetical protein
MSSASGKPESLLPPSSSRSEDQRDAPNGNDGLVMASKYRGLLVEHIADVDVEIRESVVTRRSSRLKLLASAYSSDPTPRHCSPRCLHA